jgi:hypothetical protein
MQTVKPTGKCINTLLLPVLMWTPEILALIAVTFVAAGFVKGTIGLGLPTVTLAVLTLPLGLKTSLAIVVIPLMVTNLWQALTGPRLKEIIAQKCQNPINGDNKKLLIFTAFADTAEYLYANIADWAQHHLSVYSAIVSGKTNGNSAGFAA